MVCRVPHLKRKFLGFMLTSNILEVKIHNYFYFDKLPVLLFERTISILFDRMLFCHFYYV